MVDNVIPEWITGKFGFFGGAGALATGLGPAVALDDAAAGVAAAFAAGGFADAAAGGMTAEGGRPAPATEAAAAAAIEDEAVEAPCMSDFFRYFFFGFSSPTFFPAAPFSLALDAALPLCALPAEAAESARGRSVVALDALEAAPVPFPLPLPSCALSFFPESLTSTSPPPRFSIDPRASDCIESNFSFLPLNSASFLMTIF